MKSRTRRLAPLLGLLALLAVVVALEAPWRGAGQRPDEEMSDVRETPGEQGRFRCGREVS